MRRRIGPAVAAVAALAVTACSSSGRSGSTSFEVRPVLMPAQHATGGGSDPFASLRVPPDEVAYSRLSQAQQTALTAALRKVDCARPPHLSGTDARVVCDTESYAYLLGAPVVTGRDVKSATPFAPNPDVSDQWRIMLSLSTAGGERMWDWTSQHHTGFPDGEYTVSQRSATLPCGETVKTPCSDFLAYVDNDLVVTVPPTYDPFRTAVLVTGDFTKASATRLAREIAG